MSDLELFGAVRVVEGTPEYLYCLAKGIAADEVVMFKHGQWSTIIGPKVRIVVNLDSQGVPKFYEVVTGAYEAPMIVQEPALGIAVPTEVAYQKKHPTHLLLIPSDRIVGIICVESNHTVAHRFSLSNLKGAELSLNQGGKLDLKLKDGQVETWYLKALHSPDKNRMKGLVGFFLRHPPMSVRVLELEDIGVMMS